MGRDYGDEHRDRKPSFYLASGVPNIDQQRQIAAALTDRGYRQSYDWTKHGLIEDTDTGRQVVVEELEAVREADVVIILLPGGRGTHVELGAALAWGKTTFVVGSGELLRAYNGRVTLAYVHPLVRIVDSPDALLEIL